MQRTSAFFKAEQVRDAVAGATSQKQAIERLGMRAIGDNYRRLQEACVRYGLEVPGRRAAVVVLDAVGTAQVRTSRRDAAGRVKSMSAEEFGFAIAGSPNQRQALIKLGLDGHPHYYRLLRERCASLGVPPPQHQGKRVPRTGDDEYFVVGVKRNTGHMKNRLIEGGLIPHSQCAECGCDRIWNGDVLVLHLDHINGDHFDNRLENLRFLCPNCHSQTETYCVQIPYRLTA